MVPGALEIIRLAALLCGVGILGYGWSVFRKVQRMRAYRERIEAALRSRFPRSNGDSA